MSNATALDVVAAGRGWIGVPYQHQGRSREGVDCAGLVICLMRELGVVDARFDVNGYTAQPDGTLLGVVASHLQPTERGIGTVAVISFGMGPQHLAVLADYHAGGLSMIHALERNGKVVEHRLDDHWSAQIAGCFSMRGVA